MTFFINCLSIRILPKNKCCIWLLSLDSPEFKFGIGRGKCTFMGKTSLLTRHKMLTLTQMTTLTTTVIGMKLKETLKVRVQKSFFSNKSRNLIKQYATEKKQWIYTLQVIITISKKSNLYRFLPSQIALIKCHISECYL